MSPQRLCRLFALFCCRPLDHHTTSSRLARAPPRVRCAVLCFMTLSPIPTVDFMSEPTLYAFVNIFSVRASCLSWCPHLYRFAVPFSSFPLSCFPSPLLMCCAVSLLGNTTSKNLTNDFLCVHVQYMPWFYIAARQLRNFKVGHGAPLYHFGIETYTSGLGQRKKSFRYEVCHSAFAPMSVWNQGLRIRTGTRQDVFRIWGVCPCFILRVGARHFSQRLVTCMALFLCDFLEMWRKTRFFLIQ